jgi:hypothetical protein
MDGFMSANASREEYENLDIDVLLAVSMNQPELADNHAASNWIYVVRELLKFMQWPRDQWRFGVMTNAPRLREEGMSATMVFTCNGVSITADIGAFGPRNDLRIWMTIDSLSRVVDQKSLSITSSDPQAFRHVINEMKTKLYEHHMKAAFKAGNAARSK